MSYDAKPARHLAQHAVKPMESRDADTPATKRCQRDHVNNRSSTLFIRTRASTIFNCGIRHDDIDTTMSSVHADPPPPIVTEPSGINYATGSALGKGGFAICHRAERYDGSKPTGHLVALKIVKTKMEPAKLAQKVCNTACLVVGIC